MPDRPIAKRAREGADGERGDQRPAKRTVQIDDFNNMITVLVGHEEQQFTLHQDAVCAKSRFFKAACSKQWREGQEKLIRLPEVNDIHFRAYCTWVYASTLPENRYPSEIAMKEMAKEVNLCVDLYVLGDALDDIQLRNAAVMKVIECLRDFYTYPSGWNMTYIWEKTPSGSLLRKALVDIAVHPSTEQYLRDTIAEYPAEFVQEVALASLRKLRSSRWCHLQKEHYIETEGAQDNET